MARLNIERDRHWRTCETCNGDGLVYGGDPTCDDQPCPVSDCFDGEVTEWDDPLVLMHLSRGIHPAYRRARTVAMKPVSLPRYTPEPYIERLRRKDPMAAAILGPVFDGMVRMAAQSRAA